MSVLVVDMENLRNVIVATANANLWMVLTSNFAICFRINAVAGAIVWRHNLFDPTDALGFILVCSAAKVDAMNRIDKVA